MKMLMYLTKVSIVFACPPWRIRLPLQPLENTGGCFPNAPWDCTCRSPQILADMASLSQMHKHIHELPLHANRNNCKSPNFKLKEFDFTIDSETSSG